MSRVAKEQRLEGVGDRFCFCITTVGDKNICVTSGFPVREANEQMHGVFLPHLVGLSLMYV
jgi:hypothetical protein